MHINNKKKKKKEKKKKKKKEKEKKNSVLFNSLRFRSSSHSCSDFVFHVLRNSGSVNRLAGSRTALKHQGGNYKFRGSQV